ncbi:hypothetical protein QBC35DRAFT_510099 [Podospora australis]|uniref:Uncharacterized protein n=1 Tax=Podospora australis TaxID=1536484 RepID=A0AAN6WIQ8_9PEZI|nr:hypothetical protein QBC35DRAFT_510099 [Podospora australis]
MSQITDRRVGCALLLLYHTPPAVGRAMDAHYYYPHKRETEQRSGAGPQLNIADPNGQIALLWTSIAIAVFTSLIQGLITTVVTISEESNLWTFRFRIARYEHIWWTAVSSLLTVSFALIVLSFLAGNSQDSLGVLALSTATTIGIVRYAIPAWRNRFYIENRWLAWTGPSRTAIRREFRDLCGDKAQWERLSRAYPERKVVAAPSDSWGLTLVPPPGLWEDPTAILGKFMDAPLDNFLAPGGDYPCVFDDGSMNNGGGSVSLLWGEAIGFRRRVSRAIAAMPKNLLSSRPTTINEYNGEGLCLALGILGRNKGLRPYLLVYDSSDKWKKERGIVRHDDKTSVSGALENGSSWAPRANKVMRSHYGHAIQDQYGGLPEAYRDAALELALILLDIGRKLLKIWLRQEMEQQDLNVNLWMSARRGMSSSKEVGGVSHPKAEDKQLDALYRASYASMIISINYLVLPKGGAAPVRPDLTCFALLYLAESAVQLDSSTGKWVQGPGAGKPAWWDHGWVKARLQSEQQSLKEGWQNPAAWLLGLKEFPIELDHRNHPDWPRVVYEATAKTG